jgi:hypothetical protein
MRTTIIAVSIAVMISILLVLSVRFTVTDFFNQNNVAFLNEKLVNEFKKKEIKAIEYIVAINKDGKEVKIFLDSLEENTQHSENPEKVELGFVDHSLEKLNTLNQSLFALSGLSCSPLATGEPNPCLASIRKKKYVGGVWTPEHCHCTMPEGTK